jgi:hypothetical protein
VHQLVPRFCPQKIFVVDAPVSFTSLPNWTTATSIEKIKTKKFFLQKKIPSGVFFEYVVERHRNYVLMQFDDRAPPVTASFL